MDCMHLWSSIRGVANVGVCSIADGGPCLRGVDDGQQGLIVLKATSERLFLANCIMLTVENM